MVEQAAHTRYVQGSNPRTATLKQALGIRKGRCATNKEHEIASGASSVSTLTDESANGG